MLYFAFSTTFSRRQSFLTGTLRYLRKDFSWPPTPPDFNLSVRVLGGYSVSENPHTIPELKNVIQSQTSIIETIHKETLSNFFSSFVLRLHEVRDLWGHHMTTRFQSIIMELSPS
jgi:hypothetical protein